MTQIVDDLKKELAERSSEELVSILRNRDEDEWRPEVFEAAALVLKDRGISPDAVTAMGPEGIDVVESEPTVTIARFFSPAEAHACRSALEEAGISAWVIDDAGGAMYGIGIGARLQVRAKEQDAAREFLATAPVSGEELPPDIAEPPCPACGSRNVAPEAWVDGEGSREDRWSFGHRKWYYVCKDCEEAWPM